MRIVRKPARPPFIPSVGGRNHVRKKASQPSGGKAIGPGGKDELKYAGVAEKLTQESYRTYYAAILRKKYYG